MTLRRAAWPAAVLALLLCTGCAMIGKASPGETAPASGPAVEPEPEPSTLGVLVEVDAPAPLKELLGRHLDLVRLGGMRRDDVDDTEWSRLIDATPAQAADLLRTEGHFSPHVMLERAPGRAAGRPDLVRLRVDPGPRAIISRVTIEVEGELERGAGAGDGHARATLDELRAGWELPVGSSFRNPDWSDAKANALARLRGAGYATATWSGTGAEVDVARNEVRLFLVADSGPLFRFGTLQIEGLVAHDADTVRNLADASPGAPVTETLILDFQDRLAASGLFESVTVTLDTDPEQAAAARIVARLRESPLQVYTFGVGYSANNRARASVEHAWRRVLGAAASARNKVEWGQKRQAWDGELSSHPGANLYRNLIGGAVENLESDSDTVLSQRLRVGRTQDMQRLERLYFIEAERSRRTLAGGRRSDAFALSVNYHGVWRALDSVILPTEGYTFAGHGGIGRSHGTDARSGPYTRAYARLDVYHPLGRAWFGQARLELGQVFLRRNMVVPESQKWRAGGDDSVRGYGYRSLGPQVGGVVGGGVSLLTASAEVARPIAASMPSLWGALFVDAGNAADRFEDLRPVWGTGVGIRWRSPVGPLRLDWAWGHKVRQARLHFSVGIAF